MSDEDRMPWDWVGENDPAVRVRVDFKDQPDEAEAWAAFGGIREAYGAAGQVGISSTSGYTDISASCADGRPLHVYMRGPAGYVL